MIKRLRQSLLGSAAMAKLVSAQERVADEQDKILRILTYHRVDHQESRPSLYPRVTVTPEDFAEQMNFLAQQYAPISLPDLMGYLENNSSALPPRAVLVTFDDAYCDFAEQAWPIMKREKIPATLFVPTAFPDHPQRFFWWDRLFQALRTTPRRDLLQTPVGELPLETEEQREKTLVKMRDYVKTRPHAEAMAWIDEVCDELDALPPEAAVLGWADLRRLASEGVTLGAHTRTHPLVNRISLQQARAEALGSLHDLQAQIGPVMPVFAYPSGGVSDEVVAGLAEDGFTLAFTTVRGLNSWPLKRPLQLRRINVGPGTNMTALRMQLLPQFGFIDRWVS
ncbi:MAG: polysaccharide deacetylase family protein [Candidatus Promineifilaceae bacterium]|nr:polysaccharide deacetylase family protein [Candidatus Promineifilaceae bacterium]